jgi:hypothetical protein
MSRPRRSATATARPARRGVSSVLSMMFLVIFGSLGVAMAVVAQGNLRTADSALRVSRAQSAAETGLAFAARRLQEEAARFVIRDGVIDATLAEQLWRGTYTPTEPGDLAVLPSPNPGGLANPRGIAEAILAAHLDDADIVIIDPGDALLPRIDEESGQLDAPPIRLGPLRDADAPAPPRLAGATPPLHFRVSYRLLPGEPVVRIVGEGRDGPIRRTVQMDFRLDKRIEYAVLSPNRIMIGKNVQVHGPLGSTFGLQPGQLDATHGQPLLVRSDFRHLDPLLDERLEAFHAAVALHDTDGDGRLRIHHPLEGQGLADLDGAIDRDGNQYLDEFDLFLAVFDANGDGRVVWDPARAAAAGLGTLEGEFVGIDDQLARLIDLGNPDRNHDGVVDAEDVRLGWNDGVIDARDRYAKIHGPVRLAITREAWEEAAGVPWRTFVEGPIRSGDDPPVTFGVPLDELRMITTDMFTAQAQWYSGAALDTFDAQVAENVSAGATFTPADEGLWEEVPYGSPNAYDWYRRPVYEGMTFRNVRIPRGNNGLFIDCRFEGVVYIETESQCVDVHWNFAGAVERVEEGESFDHLVRFPTLTASLPDSPEEIADTKPHSNNLRFHNCTFLGSIAGDTPQGYAHWRNKLQFTGSTRIYSRGDDPELLAQPDGPLLRAVFDSMAPEVQAELRKSSMMLPGWSVDMGNFTNLQAEDPLDTPRIRMSGTVVAGVLDIRGTADINGTLLMTFEPVVGEGPLFYGGRPGSFNTTIGYFGPADGDGEGALPGEDTFEGFGEIRLRWDPGADLPDGIPWPIRVTPIADTYREARSAP